MDAGQIIRSALSGKKFASVVQRGETVQAADSPTIAFLVDAIISENTK